MRTAVRIALVLLAAAFVGAFVWMLLYPPSSGGWVGKPARPTNGTDADGRPMQLSDSLGKVVLLDFWGNW
jgi:cytochrome oxidase Cu insertion factor (SCO1/SenC/PrrC family)